MDLQDQQEHAVDQPENQSLGELFAKLSREFGELMRQEVQLAKTELREEASKSAKAGGMFGGAALAAYFSLLLLSFAAAWGLAEVIPIGYAFLIVALIHAMAAGFLFLRARNEMQQMNPIPDETIETLKEDVEWAKAQVK